MQAMLRALGFALALSATPLAAQQGPKPLSSALAAVRAGNWDNAAAIARRAGPVAESLVEWHRLRAGEGTMAEVRDFVSAHPDWPGLDLMFRRTEARALDSPVAEVLRFFEGHAPVTGTGALALAQALQVSGRRDEIAPMLRKLWRDAELDSQSEEALLAQFGDMLSPDNAARLDALLWAGETAAAERMLLRVDQPIRALAQARLALKAQRDGVDSLIAAVPDALRNDPGLAYDRTVWRIRKGRTDNAVQLMLERSKSADGLGRPQVWSGWRRNLARERMRAGKAAEAYMLASSHKLSEGSAYSDLEWIAGYVALRYLGEPALALDHFQRFRSSVEGPISLGRAGYWIGRAQEALGDAEAARLAYAEGAAHQTSFYGLLAAERVELPFDPVLAESDPGPDWRGAAFTQTSLFRAGLLALNAGELSLAERFLVQLAGQQDASGLAMMGRMALDLDEPHLAVMIGKQAAGQGVVLPAPYYALHPLRAMELPVPVELSLAIARRESEFDPDVVSGAGAQGLMQLMPATAAEVAAGLGLDHDPRRVLSDPTYNATLGSAYLATLSRRFSGNVVMVAAAYNAGPSRPERWMAERGDPRGDPEGIIDWIEHVPFEETRNYIMRVTESLPIYRARTGQTPLPLAFSRELAGATLPR